METKNKYNDISTSQHEIVKTIRGKILYYVSWMYKNIVKCNLYVSVGWNSARNYYSLVTMINTIRVLR